MDKKKMDEHLASLVRTHDDDTDRLWDLLENVLNALEAAGEKPAVGPNVRIVGATSSVRWDEDEETWTRKPAAGRRSKRAPRRNQVLRELLTLEE